MFYYQGSQCVVLTLVILTQWDDWALMEDARQYCCGSCWAEEKTQTIFDQITQFSGFVVRDIQKSTHPGSL